jgi:hypothetical protein
VTSLRFIFSKSFQAYCSFNNNNKKKEEKTTYVSVVDNIGTTMSYILLFKNRSVSVPPPFAHLLINFRFFFLVPWSFVGGGKGADVATYLDKLMALEPTKIALLHVKSFKNNMVLT